MLPSATLAAKPLIARIAAKNTLCWRPASKFAVLRGLGAERPGPDMDLAGLFTCRIFLFPLNYHRWLPACGAQESIGVETNHSPSVLSFADSPSEPTRPELTRSAS